MFVVYIVVLACVMVLLLSALLFPFWKVWARLKNNHPDIWAAAGPFRLRDMLGSPGLLQIFFKVLTKINTDTDLKQRDPELARWSVASVEMVRVMPRSFGPQAVLALLFLYLAHRIASALLGLV